LPFGRAMDGGGLTERPPLSAKHRALFNRDNRPAG
jgi:hypothetical protein